MVLPSPKWHLGSNTTLASPGTAGTWDPLGDTRLSFLQTSRGKLHCVHSTYYVAVSWGNQKCCCQECRGSSQNVRKKAENYKATKNYRWEFTKKRTPLFGGQYCSQDGEWEDEDDDSADPTKQLENKLLSDLLSQFAPAAEYGFDAVADEEEDPDALNDPVNQIELQVR